MVARLEVALRYDEQHVQQERTYVGPENTLNFYAFFSEFTNELIRTYACLVRKCGIFTEVHSPRKKK